jgi:hypothetical protein
VFCFGWSHNPLPCLALQTGAGQRLQRRRQRSDDADTRQACETARNYDKLLPCPVRATVTTMIVLSDPGRSE